MALGDSRIVIPTKVDDFDPGYFSKIFEEGVLQQNKFDPDYVSKILEKEARKQKEEIKDPGQTSKTEERLAQLAEKEALFALRRSSYPFPARPPYYKPNFDSEEELADLNMTREEWKAHLDKHPGRDPTVLWIRRFFECVEADRKGELPPRKSPQPKSDDDSDYELPEDDGVGCFSGIYATRRLAEESGGGFNREINPNFLRDIGFTVDNDADIYVNDFTDDDDDYADDDDDFTDDEDDDGLKDEIVVNSGTSSAPAASNMGE